MNKRKARREYRKLATKLRFRAKNNGNKKQLTTLMTIGFTPKELSLFIVNSGNAYKLANTRMH